MSTENAPENGNRKVQGDPGGWAVGPVCLEPGNLLLESPSQYTDIQVYAFFTQGVIVGSWMLGPGSAIPFVNHGLDRQASHGNMAR